MAIIAAPYFANSAMASSASTPPVIEIGTNSDWARTSALEIMIWLIRVIRQATPYRDHLAMRGRVAVGAAEIAAARNDRAVAHDHRAERKVGLPRLLDRHAHEALVLGRAAAGLRQTNRGQHRGAGEAGHEGASARKGVAAGRVAATGHGTTSLRQAVESRRPS
jgi:hypothetical protein